VIAIERIKRAGVLVVDDEPANVKLLERMLAQEGYTNVTATMDPEEAVTLYRRNHYDIVLLDLNMPRLDGFGVMKALTEIDHADIPPILVITAQTDRDSRLRALQEGGRDFLNKPFDRVELMARIRNMLEMRLLHNDVRDQNEILETRVQERTLELHDTRLEIIRRLGRAAEYRDNETGLHIIRMSKTSALLGQAVGMSAGESELMLNASPMHDIGKIGIPDRILLKPGKLDPDEWTVMKTHTTIGAEMLSGHNSELMEMAAEIALSHHEKFDGSGYPRGLKGTAIPLTGRVVALADVFDALTSERPYKKAWPVADALRFIDDNRGSHFDPAVVDAFHDSMPAIEEIRTRYAEPGSAE
jgi:putative two-component system response regulator